MSGYWLVRGLARFLLSLFYRRVEVVGLEQIPPTGPVILAANHQNALVDPMLLMATLTRRLRPLAKAPLFRHPLIAPFLRLTGVIPVYRRQDPGTDPALNKEMFRIATATLLEGGVILIFPEGLSQPEPVLMQLRTGAARMLLEAEAASAGGLAVKLLPVGLTFREPGSFRTGWALVLAGAPIHTDDCIGLYRSEPEKAVRELTDRLAEALRRLIVEAEDRQTLRLLHVVEAIKREESPGEVRDLAERAEWMQWVMRAYRYLNMREPARVENVRREVERYAKDLELAGLTGRQLSQSYRAGVVLRYAFREGLSLLFGLPFALWGIANHVIPYQLTRLAVRLNRPSPDTESTYKLGAGVVLYPICWACQGWIVWQLGGGWSLAAFISSLVPTGFFALTWRERLGRFSREALGFFRFLFDQSLHRRLLARRHTLMEQLTALGRLVPDSVLAGEKKGR